MGVSQSMGGFYAARFFLGVTESGLFPDEFRGEAEISQANLFRRCFLPFYVV